MWLLQQSWAYASKSLIAKFINTGWVVLVVYGTLPSNLASPVQVLCQFASFAVLYALSTC